MAQWQTDYVQQPEPQSPKTLKGSTASDRCREPIEREAGERDGGMFALQIDVERVSMWFWSRQYIPFSISQAKFREGMNVDISDWRRPSAVYPAVGHGQKLALGVTLCGDQAGEPEVHTETCLDPGVGESQCHHGPNSFTSAYWEISYIRTFTLHAVRRKPRLFARAESGTSTTSSIDLLPSIHLSIKINPPHPTLFKPTTVATTATSHSDGQVVAETGTASTITIFNPTSTEDPRFTRTWVKATVVIFQPTTGSVFVATVAATSTPEAGDNETDTVSDIAATPTSSQSTATVVDITVGGSVKSITLTVPGVGVVGATTRLGASGPTFSQTDATLPSGSSSNPGSLTGISVDVVDITVGGSVESITLTVPGVGVVGATTSNSVGLGASSQTDATLPSGSAVSSNAGSLTRISVDLLVAGLVLSIFAEIHIT
ncbi:hypothetical protein VNI00_015243 [Paramarasmius palmivorus]|uniref:Uncharacterized protein n=1 Tax=Paramarasmius palmivorus TaxID=297713 RepID=A0AAW0BLL6_9AGAR